MTQKRHTWTADDDAVLRARYAHEQTDVIARDMGLPIKRVYARASALGLHKSAEFFETDRSGRIQRGRSDPRMRATQFKKGLIPANKGLRRPGWSAGRMRETQFKKGQVSGRAAEVYKPVGTERITRDGYLERKIHEGLPLQSRWRAVHIVEWEAVNGPLPVGHALVFRNGDKTDRRLDNLELVSRAELMRRNSYHNRYPKEIGLAIQLRGALIRKINRKVKREKQD